jgi:predicted XRE-type DNA-binding protein
MTLHSSKHRPVQNLQAVGDLMTNGEPSAKMALAAKINELIEQRCLSQTEVAYITSMTQPKVSQVRRFKLQNISLERLMQALVSLDQHVEIVVRPALEIHSASITVQAV